MNRREPRRRPRGRRGGARSGRRWTGAALLVAALAAGWALWRHPGALGDGAAAGPAPDGTAAPPAAVEPAARLRAEIVATYPHDPGAYTQGLVLAAGALWESTGRYGHSTVRRVDLASGRVLAQTALADDLFGEGLAWLPGAGGAPDRLVQLTWQAGLATVWDAATLTPAGEHGYRGEGWGLCRDGAAPGGPRLVMSDGSARLTFRDPATFAVRGSVGVTLDGRPLDRLNELECVGGRVYANVYTTDELVEIDPEGGRVTAVVDAAGLLSADEAAGAEVLNGIAYDPADGTFLLTGKLWPKLFRVRFVPAG